MQLLNTFSVRKHYLFTASLLLVAILAVATVASASEGVFLLGNDAQQLGRASSGVASPRSAYWSYLNPATMTDLERRIDINFYSVFTDIELKPRGPLGNWIDGDQKGDGFYEIFSGGMIWPLEDGVLGGGLYIPSGTGVEYPHSRNIISRIFGNNDRRLNYQHIRLVLAYAKELGDGWSLGFGLHGSVSRFQTDHITLKLRCAEFDNEWDEALGAGFGIGIYKKWERWAFGLVYNSRHWTQSMNEYDDLLKSPLDTPHVVQAGVAYKLTPKIELTADLKYLNWEDVATYGAHLVPDSGFTWSDQYGYKLGIEWTASKKLTLMAGFSHTNTPIDEDHVFLSGLVPVAVEDHVTAGFTYRINEKHEIHLVGIHGIKNDLQETGKGLREGDILSPLGVGSELLSNGESFVLGYSYKF